MSAADLDKVLADMAARTTGTLAANFLTCQIDPEAVAADESVARISAVEPAAQIISSWAGG